MNKFSKKILDQIQEKKIAPRERWIFLVKNYGVWALVILALLLAVIFSGSTMHDVRSAEWEIAGRFPGGPAAFVAQMIPVLWLLGIAAAFIFAFFLFRQTKHGYRLGFLSLSGIILAVSVVGGLSLLATPLPPRIQEFRLEHLPPKFETQEWMNPEEGLLFGKVAELGEKLLILNAIDNSLWEVDISEAKIPPFVELEIGQQLRIIGEQTDENEFLAEFVRPGDPRELPRLPKKFNERKDRRPAY